MPLLLPLSSIQELTPEELEPLKDALLAHLRARNPRARQQVDSQLHVTKGDRIPAYRFTLEVLLESRDAKPDRVIKPLTPELEKKVASAPTGDAPKASEDVWLFPSEERPDFSSHTGTYFITGSLKAEDCRECFQRGEMGCKVCLGKGEESCPTCLGGGSQPCIHCKGLEKISCLKCGGEGRLAAGGVGGRSTRCDACNGTGKFPCTHCKDGKLPCPQCRGGGKATCHECKGKGKVLCVGCEGSKRVAVGQAFRSEFKPFHAQSEGLVVAGPKEALEMAMVKTEPVGSMSLPLGEPFEKQVQSTDLPPPVKAALRELSERVIGRITSGTRAVKYRLAFDEGSVVRLSGYCAGQEFSFWTQPGQSEIVTEKDPVAALGNTVALVAEEALRARDWRKAIDLAKETLSYTPDHVGAADILAAWRKKVVVENLLLGLAAGAMAALGNGLAIMKLEKGLNKMGAMTQMGVLQISLGLITGAILIVPSLKLYRGRVRLPVLLGCLLFVFLSAAAAARWMFDWNPVMEADQRALDAELADHFKMGQPVLFYEPDLRFLQSLNIKYKDSSADLTKLKSALDLQISLKARRAQDQLDFDAQVEKIVTGDGPIADRRAALEHARSSAKLINLNLAKSDAALDRLRQEEVSLGLQRNTRRQRISIVPAGSSRKASSLSMKSSPKKKPSTTASKKSAPSKSASKTKEKSKPKSKSTPAKNSTWW